MDVVIRPARVEDADAVARLTLQLGYEVTASALAAKLARILSRTDQQLLVAEHDGRAIGWLHEATAEFLETEPFVVIAGLVVDKDHRGGGIGRMLIEQAEAWAGSQGCSLVRLWSTSTRTSSHRFYEGLGYTNVKTQYAFAKSLEAGVRRGFRETCSAGRRVAACVL